MSEWTIERLDRMSHLQLGALIRFAEPGHPVFVITELSGRVFSNMEQFGGMSRISKELGWDTDRGAEIIQGIGP